jgi:hypothetical protein
MEFVTALNVTTQEEYSEILGTKRRLINSGETPLFISLYVVVKIKSIIFTLIAH